MVKTAMLMAAGLGTRLRPFTDREPKAVLPLLGIPMAQFAIDALVSAGVSRIVANVHHLAPTAESRLKALELGGSELRISDETSELLGSAGGPRHALGLLGSEPFFLVNADVLCGIDLSELARAHERNRARWGVSMTLTLFRKAPGKGLYREILFDESLGLVTGTGEPARGAPFFVGAAVLEPEALELVPEKGASEFLPKILLPAIEKRKAGIHIAQGLWFDVGSPLLWLETHLELMRRMETGQLPGSWRRRIEEKNARLAQNVWISKSAPRVLRTIDWSSPCYWSPHGDPSARPPMKLGPRAVLYGDSPEGIEAKEGIGLGGLWVPLGEPA